MTEIVCVPAFRRITRPNDFAPRSEAENVYGVGRNAWGSLLENVTVPV